MQFGVSGPLTDAISLADILKPTYPDVLSSHHYGLVIQEFNGAHTNVFEIPDLTREGANKSMVAQAHSQVTNQGGLLQA